jgi:RNA polymerase sigma-70 factor (ECF subfamily)
MSDLDERFTKHRPALLRHCYRMLGSYPDAEDLVQDTLLNAWKARDSYAGNAPLGHWLMRIATNACLNELAKRKRRALPNLELPAAQPGQPLVESDASEWVTPAPDARLFAPSSEVLEARESVALAFVALLQRLPPRQRAVFVLKEIVGWSSDEIATALDMTLASVSSALHRARESIPAPPGRPPPEPSPDVLRAYLRSWEDHDVDGLVALLREDVVFAMPPHTTWFRGARALAQFLRNPPFSTHWSAGYRTITTRANNQLAIAFYRPGAGAWVPSSLQLVEFADGKLVECTAFVRASLRGFDLPAQLELDHAPDR